MRFFSLFSTLFLIALLFQSPVTAASAPVTPSSSVVTPNVESQNRGLYITPPKYDIEVDKNITYEYVIKVTNDTTDQLYNMISTVETFTANESGSGPVITRFEPGDSRSQIVKLDSPNFTLQPGKSRQVVVNFSVPQDAPSGGYYFAIIFTNQNTAQASVKINQRIASLLFVNAGKDTKRGAKVEQFAADNKIVDPIFDGFDAILKLKSEDNYFLKPSGIVQLDTEKMSTPLFDEDTILLDKARTFRYYKNGLFQIPYISKNSIENTGIDGVKAVKLEGDAPLFGTHTLTTQLQYVDENGETIVHKYTTNITFFPWKTLLIIAAFILVFLLIGLGFKRISRRRVAS